MGARIRKGRDGGRMVWKEERKEGREENRQINRDECNYSPTPVLRWFEEKEQINECAEQANQRIQELGALFNKRTKYKLKYLLKMRTKLPKLLEP